MGLLDKVTALLPWRRSRQDSPSRSEVVALRDDVDRWFARVLEDPWAVPAFSDSGWLPTLDVRENDTEVVVTAEVPGLDRDDLDVSVSPDGLLTIRGEKREEREDTQRDYRVVERRYGGFRRAIPLPPGLDADGARARVRHGVLTVTIPRAASSSGTRRIPVKT
jgi:HSP20 family protein